MGWRTRACGHADVRPVARQRSSRAREMMLGSALVLTALWGACGPSGQEDKAGATGQTESGSSGPAVVSTRTTTDGAATSPGEVSGAPGSIDALVETVHEMRCVRRRPVHEMRSVPRRPPYRETAPEMYELICARYTATRAICEALDRRPERAAAGEADLYYALGYVKDPTTIEWLRSKLKGPQAPVIREHWLDGWEETAQCPTLPKWLDCPERWCEFLSELCADGGEFESSELVLLVPWAVDDPNVHRFYRARVEGPNVTPEIIIREEGYLRVFGGSVVTAAELADAIRLVEKRRGPQWFVDWPRSLTCEEVVPILISALGPGVEEADRAAIESLLAWLTFAQGVSGQAAWSAWYDQHRDQPRAVWVAATLDEIDALLPENVEEVRRLLATRWGRNEPLLFPYLKKWSRYKALHKALLPYLHVWITLIHRYRDGLQPVADEILRQSREELAASEMDGLLLRWYGYIDAANTWEDFVGFNMRMHRLALRL